MIAYLVAFVNLVNYVYRMSHMSNQAAEGRVTDIRQQSAYFSVAPW
jgi:hypothetical protein